MAVKNEVIIAFLVTILAMVVFGCLQGPPVDTVDTLDPVEEPTDNMVDADDLEVGIEPIDAEVLDELEQPFS